MGTAVGRALVDAGYEVTLSGSGDPEPVSMITAILVPGTRALWAKDAVTEADLIILAIPMHRLKHLDQSLLTGRVVVDATNYWPPVDGELDEFESAHDGSSSMVQRMFPEATIVKTLNHVGYHDLEPGRRPAGDPDRLGLAVAGDDAGAVAIVAEVLDRIGYDPILLSSLAAGRILQPGSDLFGARLTAEQIARAVGGGRRLRNTV